MPPCEIGQLIKQVVDKQQWSYTDFAKAINTSRSSVYNIFNSRDISLYRLLQISRVLNYDFIKDVVAGESGSNVDVGPYIALPIRDRRIDLSELPEEIIQIIKSEL